VIAAGAILLLQGIVRDRPLRDLPAAGRLAVAAKRTFEEVDVDQLKEMGHVKDEDIARLDDLVVHKEPAK